LRETQAAGSSVVRTSQTSEKTGSNADQQSRGQRFAAPRSRTEVRIVAMVAVFLLAVATIVEGAIIVRLSRRVDALAEKAPVRPAEVIAPSRAPTPAPKASPELAARSLPRLTVAPEPTPEAPGGPATAVLGEALATPEGRQHLKAAMEVLREEERKERLVRSTERALEREQRRRENLTRLLVLPPDEQNKINQFYLTLQTGRQRVIEEMRAGVKNAEQADDEIDTLEDETDRQVRSLLGEQRMQKFRELSRANRRRERGQGGQDGVGGAPASAPQTPPPPGGP
jgi:hypothetical protein